MAHMTVEIPAPSVASWARRCVLWTIVGAALAVHAALWQISDIPESRPLWGDEKMYWHGANQLAAGKDWHPEPLWPPLYPRMLSVIVAAGGSIATVRAIQTLMLVVLAWLLRDLTRRLTGSGFAGDVAGALTLIYPPLASFAHFLWPEVFHLLLFIGALWILVQRPQRSLWLLAAGALLGLCLLTKSLLGPFLPFLLLPLALEGSIRERAARIGLVLLATLVVIAPTVISNHRRDTGVWIANSVAFNLWVGLNERSRKTFVDPVAFHVWREYAASGETFPERNAFLWGRIRGFLGEQGTLDVLWAQLSRQYFRLFDRDSCLTDMLPGGGVTDRGGGYRDPPSWIANGLRTSSYLLYAAILIGTVVGIAVTSSRAGPSYGRWLKIVLLFLAYNLGLFLWLHVKSRFRIPLLPFFFLYSGCAAAWLAYRLGLNPEEAELWNGRGDSWRGSLTTLASLGVLYLAFGRGFLF